MRRGLVAGEFTLTELFHHLGMFNACGNLKREPVLLEEIDSHVKRCALVTIHEGMVAGNRLGIAGGQLERVRFTIGVQVLRPRKG